MVSGWAVACTGFGVAGCCYCTGLVWLGYRVLPPGYGPGYRVRVHGLPVGGLYLLVQPFLGVFARL